MMSDLEQIADQLFAEGFRLQLDRMRYNWHCQLRPLPPHDMPTWPSGVAPTAAEAIAKAIEHRSYMRGQTHAGAER